MHCTTCLYLFVGKSRVLCEVEGLVNKVSGGNFITSFLQRQNWTLAGNSQNENVSIFRIF